jgi:hypothetical protein
VEKIVRKFSNFAEAEAAERAYWRSLTPEERMEIFAELQRRHQGDPPPPLERVYRIIPLSEHDD